MVTITIDKPVNMARLARELHDAGYSRLIYSIPPDTVQVLHDDTQSALDIYAAHTLTAEEQAQEDIKTQALAARQTILNTAQSAVGVQLTALTAAQVRALMACMLYAAGGVDAQTLTVKPLSEWMR